MKLSIKRMQADDLPALYGILSLCGEHMYRVQGLDHWYPFTTMEWFVEELLSKRYYGVFSDAMLVGTFTLSETPPVYDISRYWADPQARAMYFIAFAILPSHQGQGIGTWCLNQVDEMMHRNRHPYLRFDAEARNKPLLRYYEKLGYENRGLLESSWGKVVFFEKRYR